jgi:hypothetical protein
MEEDDKAWIARLGRPSIAARDCMLWEGFR